MIDSRFYHPAQSLTLAQLAEIGQGRLQDPLSSHRKETSFFYQVASLEQATSESICLFHNAKYIQDFQQSQAGVCFTDPKSALHAPKTMALILSETPQRSFALAVSALYPQTEGEVEEANIPIHPTAIVGEGTKLGHGVILQKNVKIGRNCHIGAHTFIGAGVEVGDHTWIGTQVSISHSLIGQRVVIYPGARIGQAGFGFATDQQGFISIPQLGRVLIEDKVEIGANTTIDRGSLRDTVIGKGCRLDNLVMVGHNVVLGPGCILVAQVGIAGSTTFGKGVIAAGQSGFVGHIHVGDGARIGAQSGVMRDVTAGETVFGSPASPLKQHLRQIAKLQQLAHKKGSKEEK